jgi:hypothetical protein
VTILIDADTVTVIHTDTGEVLSQHTIDAQRSYWRNLRNEKVRGSSPLSSTIVMSRDIVHI